METVDFTDAMVAKFMEDGFGVEIRPSNDSGIIFGVILPYYPFKQINRFIAEDLRPNEMALIFWDLSRSIRRLERNETRRMARNQG